MTDQTNPGNESPQSGGCGSGGGCGTGGGCGDSGACGSNAATIEHPDAAKVLINTVVFGNAPAKSSVISALEKLQGSEVSANAQMVTCTLNGVEMKVSVMPMPVPGGDIVPTCHPLYWEDASPVAAHNGHVMVNTKVLSPETFVISHSAVTAAVTAIASLPGAVGVYSGQTQTTFSAEGYRGVSLGCAADDVPPTMLWIPIWIRRNDSGSVSACTHGLHLIGHAELQVVDSSQDVADVHDFLNRAVDYIVEGHQLNPGQTIGSTPEIKHEVDESVWLRDPNQVALRIKY